MLKKLAFVTLSLGMAMQAQAFEKSQVNLDKDFWGTWTIFNAQKKCSETYQFKKPGQFQYNSLQKRMSGSFAVMRNNNDPKALDILTLKVTADNKQASCGSVAHDFNNSQLNFTLKWVSAKTAQICQDTAGKQCTSLYLIKQ
ncbi:hypothetical protein [Acinetobacter gerneri]|uniref:hypothetical protein n=1 Tax=Acinetobacter gerneri TaxID=202952 RepID=UPI003A88342C